MYYRYRVYQAIPENETAFTELFLKWLLPVQLKHGARLVGRWVSTDHSKVFAIWEYDSAEAFAAIDQAVKDDLDSAAAREYIATLPDLYTEMDEGFMTSSVPRTFFV